MVFDTLHGFNLRPLRRASHSWRFVLSSCPSGSYLALILLLLVVSVFFLTRDNASLYFSSAPCCALLPFFDVLGSELSIFRIPLSLVSFLIQIPVDTLCVEGLKEFFFFLVVRNYG